QIAPKPPEAQHVVGTSVPRLDLPDKIFGAPCFIHDLELKGMVHGRMLRPPSPGATLQSLDETKVRAMPGVIDVARDRSLIGLLAESEAAAEAALRTLSAHSRWSETPILPDENALSAWLRAQEVETSFVAGNAPSARPPVARTVRASYSRPYLAHASIGPSCALARWRGQHLHVWTHSQGIFNLRRDLMLALRAGEVVVEHVQGAGCYGHNGADDVAFDAAWLARAAGDRPVRVQWSRADELAWAPFGPAMAIDLEADLAADGAIV